MKEMHRDLDPPEEVEVFFKDGTSVTFTNVTTWFQSSQQISFRGIRSGEQEAKEWNYERHDLRGWSRK